jgi:hypothetical protein
MKTEFLFITSYVVSIIIAVFLSKKHLPAAGAFLVDTSPTVFWASYVVPPIASVGLVTMHETPVRLAALSAVQLIAAFMLMYGGAMSFMFFGPRSSYVPTFILVVVFGVPAALRVRRECFPYALPIMASCGASLGVGMSFTASGGSAPFATFVGCFQAVSLVPALLAHFSESVRTVNVHRAYTALSAIFCITAAAVCGTAQTPRQSLDSIVAGLSLANTLAIAKFEKSRKNVAPAAPADLVPMTGKTRGEELRREAAEAEAVRPTRTRAQELVCYAASLDEV